MSLKENGPVILLVWAVLAIAALAALFYARWSLAFVAVATLAASMAPAALASRFRIHLPLTFLSAIVLFIFGALFLGEAIDFYNRFWWWDVVLHGGSAVGFGMVGFVFVFYLFQGDRYAAPPWALAFIAWCFAVSIGAAWEIFEFAMDQIFGTRMQKSGLVDTMWDLIVDMLGASVGAFAGFLYLKGREKQGLPWLIAEFVRANRPLFPRRRRARDQAAAEREPSTDQAPGPAKTR